MDLPEMRQDALRSQATVSLLPAHLALGFEKVAGSQDRMESKQNGREKGGEKKIAAASKYRHSRG
jgi:hypothetical protein